MYQISKYLFASIDPHWHDDLFQFIDTGDANAEFLAFLDHDAECQRVVEIALMIVSQHLESSTRELKLGNHPIADDSMIAGFGRFLAQVLLALQEFNDHQQQEVISTMEESLGSRRRSALNPFCRSEQASRSDVLLEEGIYTH
jgi:hypothetical protein